MTAAMAPTASSNSQTLSSQCSETMKSVCISGNFSGCAIGEIQHDALHAGPKIVCAEAELGGHLEHAGVFGEHVAVDAPQAFLPSVFDDALHQQPAEAVPFEPRSDQHREFRGLLVELVLQSHEPQHLASGLVERN